MRAKLSALGLGVTLGVTLAIASVTFAQLGGPAGGLRGVPASPTFTSVAVTGTGPQALLTGTAAQLDLIDSDSAADERRWRLATVGTGGQFTMQAVNDALSASSSFLVVERTGSTVDTIALPAGIVTAATISPAALGARADNWAPAGIASAYWIRVSFGAGTEITGIDAGPNVHGRRLLLTNVSGVGGQLTSGSVNSLAANRFQLTAGVAYTLESSITVELIYDGTTGAWRVIDKI